MENYIPSIKEIEELIKKHALNEEYETCLFLKSIYTALLRYNELGVKIEQLKEELKNAIE